MWLNAWDCVSVVGNKCPLGVPWSVSLLAEIIQCFLILSPPPSPLKFQFCSEITFSIDYVCGLPDPPFSHLRDRLRCSINILSEHGESSLPIFRGRTLTSYNMVCSRTSNRVKNEALNYDGRGERGLGNKLSSSTTISLVGGAYNYNKITHPNI